MDVLNFTATALQSGQRYEASVAAINSNGIGMEENVSDYTSTGVFINFSIFCSLVFGITFCMKSKIKSVIF